MEDIKPAGFWIRLLALFIDGLILVIPYWGLTLLSSSVLFSPNTPRPGIIFQLVMLVLGIVYYVAFLSSSWQATPGKRMLNIYVVRANDGSRLKPTRALSRYIILHAATLLFLTITFISPASILPNEARITQQENQQYLTQFNVKIKNHETLTPEENQHLQQIRDQTRKQFIQVASLFGVILLLFFGYDLVIALMVGLTRYKTGPHDLIAKTRALRGRPEAPRFNA